MKKYNKWGYIFIAPYVLAYMIFTAIPLIKSIVKSFFMNYWMGLTEIGPKFVFIENYIELLKNPDLIMYFENTIIMWLLGFVPQLFVSLLLAAWFSNERLNLKCSRLFKTVIYFPNLIMAATFAALFVSLFADKGPINSFLTKAGIMSEPFKFFSNVMSTRALVAFMNFIMWFGNTTLLLLAGMLGIDESLKEAAEVDGATTLQVFFKITLPSIKPIMIYVMVTSLIGGIQMFDVPQILTGGTGNPMRKTMTLLMYLNKHMFSKNYGMAGALSVILFVCTALMSIVVFISSKKANVSS